MRPTVLLYNLENETGRKIRLLCMQCKLRARGVVPAQYRQTLAALAGTAEEQPCAPAQAEEIPEPMLLLCGLSEHQLNALLRGFRTGRIAQIPLKAVLTPTNRDWDSVTLYHALQEEHSALHGGAAPESAQTAETCETHPLGRAARHGQGLAPPDGGAAAEPLRER